MPFIVKEQSKIKRSLKRMVSPDKFFLNAWAQRHRLGYQSEREWTMRLLAFMTGVILSLNCGGSPGTAPDVLLITLDTTRWDYLSCYSNDLIVTPNLDSLAGSGVLFSHATTTAPVTLPAHASIMTGLYPPGHGVRNNGNYRLVDGVPSIASVLSDNGYMTGAVIGAFVLHSQFGLDAGFKVYDDNIRGGGRTKSTLRYIERRADEVTDIAISFVEKAGSSPYLLWVHYFDPHNTYDPPEPYATKYRDNLYAGEIAYVDACLGRLLRRIADRPDERAVITVIVGDHGEDLGDHGEMSHGAFVYESTMRVPLILSYPEKVPAGLICDRNVSVVDIFPTILELLELSPEGLNVHGESLLKAIVGQEAVERPIYIETRFPLENFGWSPLEGIIFENWKYIKAPTEELYNISEDPLEKLNVCESESGQARRMAAMLDSLCREISQPARDAGFVADAETIEKLESLGYTVAPAIAQGGLKDPKVMINPQRPRGEGAIHYERGDYEEAEKAFAKSLENDPTNIMLRNYRGLALSSIGRLDEAIGQWEAALELNPRSIDVRINLGAAYLTIGKTDLALETYDDVLDLNPNYVKALIGKGKTLRARGELSRAVIALEKAIRVDPQDPVARMWIGIVYNERGNKSKALEELNLAIDMRPGMKRALREKAMVLIDLGEPGEAAEILEELASKDPARSGFMLDLGYALEMDGKLEDALMSYKKAARLDSTSFMAFNNIGSLLERMGDEKAAERALKRAIELKADFPQAYFNLGTLLARQGRKAEARRALTRFLSLWQRDDDMRHRAEGVLEDL